MLDIWQMIVYLFFSMDWAIFRSKMAKMVNFNQWNFISLGRYSDFIEVTRCGRLDEITALVLGFGINLLVTYIKSNHIIWNIHCNAVACFSDLFGSVVCY